MNACVVYDTRYGNTGQIAASLAVGLEQSGLQTICTTLGDVRAEALEASDFICVGGPTEWLSASKKMKEFLKSLDGSALSGKLGFAFDTKLGRSMSGSAAKAIEKELRGLGVRIVAPRESAKVVLENGSTSGARLEEGERERFEKIGLKIGLALAGDVGRAKSGRSSTGYFSSIRESVQATVFRISFSRVFSL